MTELEKSVLSILSADARLTPEAIASMLQEEPEKISSLIRSFGRAGLYRQIYDDRPHG